MPTYSPAQLADAMRRAGFPESEIATGVAVATAESGRRSEATNNGTKETPEHSVGPWQINLDAHGGAISERAARDLGSATSYAYTLWKSRGWKPWGVYTRGTYRQYLADAPPPGSGGGISEQLATEEDGMDEDELQLGGGAVTAARIAELVRQHGNYSATKRKGTERIENPNRTETEKIRGLNEEIDNPDPVWDIVFANGKKLTVRGERDEAGESTGNWLPISGTQTALTQPTAGTGAIWQLSPDGTEQRRVKVDPATGRMVPVLDGDGNPVTQPVRGAGGVGGRPRTAEQTAADVALAGSREAAAALSRGRLGQLGQLAPETAALREAQTEKAQAEAAVAARKLIPEQMLLLQEADQTLRYAAERYQRGESTLEELQRTSTAVNAYVDAGMRGTTPAKQEEMRAKQATERAKIGQDLLNQQVQSGTALAGNLSRDYQQLLAKTLEPPGEYDPLQRASLFTAGMGGGLQNPSTLDISGQLIGGLAGGATPMGMPQATGAPGVNWAQDYPGVPLASAVPGGAGAELAGGGEEIPEDAEMSAEDYSRILAEVFTDEEDLVEDEEEFEE